MSAAATLDEQAPGRLRAWWRHPVWGPVLLAIVGYLVLVEGLAQLLFGRIDLPFVEVPWLEVGRRSASIPRGVFLGGASIGLLYAFVAIGLILVYRANRILNFAQAQLGSVPAVLALLLIAGRGMSYWLAVPIVLLGGALLGGAVEVGVMRRFRDSSRLIATVATIGVGFVLLVAEVLIKLWLSGDDLLGVVTFPTPFNRFTVRIGPSTLFGDHLVIAVVGIAAVAALGVFLRRADLGIAIRAAAEDRDRAALLGIPVARLSTLVWVLAGVLSALAVFLRAPLVGLPLGGFVGPLFLLFGLTAAVIARMESLPVALLAGTLIGVVDAAVIYDTKRSALATAVMLVFILGALLLQRSRASRARLADRGSWETVHLPRPVPVELRTFPEVVRVRRVLTVLVVAFAVAVPWIVGEAQLGFATLTVLYALVGISLVVLTGWAGQISLGQFALAGAGAAVAGGLAANHGWDFFLAVAAGGLAGALVALVVGLPALRIQGLFLAVTTLAFAFTVQEFFLKREFFGWLLPRDLAFVNRPVLWGRIPLEEDSQLFGVTFTGNAKFYWLCLAFLALGAGAARSLRRYRSGRVMVGARDNPRVAQAFGISPTRVRIAAFTISGVIAGVAGALLAYQQRAVEPAAFPPEASIEIFVATVIGGIGSVGGAVLGAVVLFGLPLIGVDRNVQVLTMGFGVLLVLAVLPGGLAEGLEKLRDMWLRKVAFRHRLVVPSLVADVRVEEERQRDDAAVLEAAAHAGARVR